MAVVEQGTAERGVPCRLGSPREPGWWHGAVYRRRRAFPRYHLRHMIDTLRITIRIFIPPGHRAKWVGLVALALLLAVAETGTAYLIFNVLNAATGNASSTNVVDLPLGVEVSFVALVVAAGAAFVLRGLLSMFNTYAQARVVQSSGAAVSSLVHRRYLHAPYRFHLTRSSSESVRTVLWSVDQATTSALNPIIQITTQALIALALFTFLVVVSPVLSISAIVILGGGLAAILAIVQPRLGRLGKLSESTVQSLLLSVRDSFDSVRDIKVYQAEAYFDRQFARHRRILARLRTSKALLEQIPATSLEFMVVLGLLLVIGLAQGGDSFSSYVPVLGAFGYAALRITPSLNKVVSNVNRLRFAEQAVRNVDNDLRSAVPADTEEPPRDADTASSRAGGRSPALFTTSIDLDDIVFTYPESTDRALDRVTLSIRRGEMLAIVGGSGSGKSTLIDVVLGLLDPDSGHIAIDGATTLPAGWQRHVGVVSQSVVLLDSTVRDNVAFGAGSAADDDRVRLVLEQAQLGEWLSRLPTGLDTVVGESGKLVSGGERQRIAVARSLYREPDLLVLDEATSAIDGATEAALVAGLAGLSDAVTTIIVSHRVAPIRAADRIVMMELGSVTAVGSYDQLVADASEFRDLVGM